MSEKMKRKLIGKNMKKNQLLIENTLDEKVLLMWKKELKNF